MAQVTGIMTVKVDGRVMRTKENSAKLSTGGKERTPIAGSGRIHGYSEKVVPAELEVTLIHMADTDVKLINSYVDVTVDVECDTGVIWQMNHAFTTAPCQLSEGEGELSLNMASEPATQTT